MWEDYRDKVYETDNCYVPSRTMDAIFRYIEEGRHPGGFLYAVLVGNLYDTIAQADAENRVNLTAIVRFLYNHCPSDCWGNEKKFSAWIKRRGLKRG